MEREKSSHIAVKNLQTYLRQLAYHDPAIYSPPVDGVFDESTRRSLSDFQREYGLPVTGIADQLTWETLYNAYRLSLAEEAPLQKMEVFPEYPHDYVLKSGAFGFPVAALQHMLRELEAVYGKIGDMKVDGNYDNLTAEAVRIFQRQNTLPPTGTVNKITWNWITDQYNQLFSHSRG